MGQSESTNQPRITDHGSRSLEEGTKDRKRGDLDRVLFSMYSISESGDESQVCVLRSMYVYL